MYECILIVADLEASQQITLIRPLWPLSSLCYAAVEWFTHACLQDKVGEFEPKEYFKKQFLSPSNFKFEIRNK